MYIKPCKLPATIAARMKSRWTSAIAPAYFCAIALLGSRTAQKGASCKTTAPPKPRKSLDPPLATTINLVAAGAASRSGWPSLAAAAASLSLHSPARRRARLRTACGSAARGAEARQRRPAAPLERFMANPDLVLLQPRRARGH